MGEEDGADGPDGLRQWVIDSELAAERLAVATRRMVGHGDTPDADDRTALADGVRALVAATAVGTPHAMAASLFDAARTAVDGLVQRSGGVDAAARIQRIAFAVLRLSDAVETTVAQVRDRLGERRPPAADPADSADDDKTEDGTEHGKHETDRSPGRHERTDEGPGRHEAHPGAAGPASTDTPEKSDDDDSHDSDDSDEPADVASGPGLYTRQAVQVGVATSLAIVGGELISPSRWYWAVIAAFVVFAGTTSRGDVLSRGWQRVVGTIGGVVAGMVLALLVGGQPLPALVLLFACMFLALYLVRISQALMAFWITAVLALLYGLIGQFSVETLVLRIEETAVGAALGILAAFLVLPSAPGRRSGRRSTTRWPTPPTGVAGAVDRVSAAPARKPAGEVGRAAGRPLGTVPTGPPAGAPGRPASAAPRVPARRGVVAGIDQLHPRTSCRDVRTLHDPASTPTLDPAAAGCATTSTGCGGSCCAATAPAGFGVPTTASRSRRRVRRGSDRRGGGGRVGRADP